MLFPKLIRDWDASAELFLGERVYTLTSLDEAGTEVNLANLSQDDLHQIHDAIESILEDD